MIALGCTTRCVQQVFVWFNHRLETGYSSLDFVCYEVDTSVIKLATRWLALGLVHSKVLGDEASPAPYSVIHAAAITWLYGGFACTSSNIDIRYW